MRTVTALSTATVALLAVACSAKPPTYCGDAIAQQSVFVGEQVTIEPCFEDPGGGTLKLAAASSDESVARAFLLRDNVGVGGVSPGEAQVTITATNEDDQSAETTFSVLVPNRAPEFISDLKEADVKVNRSLEWNLAEFFEEPDREEMTFEAAPSNSAVSVTVDGSVAEVFGLTGGASQITLTATDPHGSEGTGTIEVTVKTPVLVWEDDFETDASLDDWAADDESKIWVEDGSLHVQTLENGRYGIAERDADDVKDFEFAFTSLTPDGGQSGLIWLTGETTGDLGYRFVMGRGGEGNWSFDRFAETNWVDVADGTSNFIEYDEMQDVTLSFSDGNLRAIVDGGEVVDVTIDGSTPTMELLWLIGPTLPAEYGYAKLSGFLDPDHGAKRRKIALPMLDMLIKR